ncbi:SMC-Scp complex subunit ScpB [Lapidilactobacillus luobeiensis]|uniref:SMC-Scp complex subunit ScpB n=1 Tax=Lapidilactobacillus luobeiensis TaxID=2950371 RepID=UPI0035A24D7C
MEYQGEIESILYTVGDAGITLKEMAGILGIHPSALRQLLEQLQTTYDQGAGGLTILTFGERYQLATKAGYAPLLHQYFAGHQPNSLSQAALETMAIVAYQQPVTRIEIDEIRGVKSAGALQTLMARQMIKESGRKEAPGRPILYGTTAYFLDYFGLKSLKQLPDLKDFSGQPFDQQGNLDLFFDQANKKNVPLPATAGAETDGADSPQSERSSQAGPEQNDPKNKETKHEPE